MGEGGRLQTSQGAPNGAPRGETNWGEKHRGKGMNQVPWAAVRGGGSNQSKPLLSQKEARNAERGKQKGPNGEGGGSKPLGVPRDPKTHFQMGDTLRRGHKKGGKLRETRAHHVVMRQLPGGGG